LPPITSHLTEPDSLPTVFSPDFNQRPRAQQLLLAVWERPHVMTKMKINLV
jgi:hypothetical protein